MEENSDRADKLLDQLDNMLNRQKALSEEIVKLREEVSMIRAEAAKKEEREEILRSEEPTGPAPEDLIEESKAVVTSAIIEVEMKKPVRPPEPEPSKQSETSSGLEKFIGENLINKIGIAITVIGVAIGAKYAIDHQLISPLWRIVSGYLFGMAMLAFALRLKKEYGNFSAVLLSGSMAIMYFMTYAAFSFYGLIGQVPSFILMVLFTVFTVASAINYDRQVIAHIGLVGAYAVPFILSKGSDNVTVLFTYTAIINIGILAISFKKYWKPLLYASFGITWLMYLIWFDSKFNADENIVVSAVFLILFFSTFYAIVLAFKLIRKEKFDIYDVVLMLLNSFIFYGVGYKIVTSSDGGENLTGIFTLGNAILHFLISIGIYRRKLADRNLFYLVSGLALIFIAISIPVQLNGNWVTLLWAGEAAVLFWIGRTKGVGFYEVLSYFFIYLAFFSFVQDLTPVSAMVRQESKYEEITPFINVKFISSFLTVVLFGFICCIEARNKSKAPSRYGDELKMIVTYSVAAIFLLTLYYLFSREISDYWDRLYYASMIEVSKKGTVIPEKIWNSDLHNFKTMWIVNYSLFFFSLLSVFNIEILKSKVLGLINLVINGIVILIFLTMGLFVLSELRDTYLNKTLSGYYNHGVFNIGIRYVSFIFIGILIVLSGIYIRRDFLNSVYRTLRTLFDIVLYTSLVWIISSELISLMAIMKYPGSYKLVLSILWGVYSLFLIALGIWKKKTHLRIGAFILFGATLLKLFLYDLSHLNTISKTIVFVTLGVLLLIISFLYNKYRDIISEGADECSI
jgi:hypothetical protein